MAFARGKFHLWNFKMWIRFTVQASWTGRAWCSAKARRCWSARCVTTSGTRSWCAAIPWAAPWPSRSRSSCSAGAQLSWCRRAWRCAAWRWGPRRSTAAACPAPRPAVSASTSTTGTWCPDSGGATFHYYFKDLK